MDQIDCVMLECGHMCTCTQCGKQMAECPICRQYVVRYFYSKHHDLTSCPSLVYRVVKTFKA